MSVLTRGALGFPVAGTDTPSPLPIVLYGDPVLREVAEPVRPGQQEEVTLLACQMVDTMQRANGRGLAAQQVGSLLRVIVVRVEQDPLVLVNPSYSASGWITSEEGCLSLPGAFGQVRRHGVIGVNAIGLDGKPRQFSARGDLACCIQHEVDHLDGRLFIDLLPRQQRRQALRAFEKLAGIQ